MNNQTKRYIGGLLGGASVLFELLFPSWRMVGRGVECGAEIPSF